ncbi:ExeA family protein [Xylophilus sp. Leaf220]|uniref:ExeA family protein n=1 Tax=Xylophilus sp. Leaf220 TaxID=1735686 RepID=UPI0006FCECE5|nr:AAA family ATPase [Xylophilus sp. Leaf220]KQM69817.1 peptidoglycan-binding protein [Xylophilus sp. Leaf220]
MYASFFGLRQDPFSIAPDPRYLYMSERHREALAHLLYGVGSGGGFVLLTGEIGTGKTTVCRCFLEQIPATCNVAYIFNPKLTVGELLQSVCSEFGIATRPAGPGGETVKDYIDPLNAYLLAAHAQGRSSVLIIDEAQNLSADVLEQLRLLTNLETNERKLLQIVLIGQPELRGMLAQPALEQLAQRVIARYHLDALTPVETQHYIAHRLGVAGLQGPMPFDRGALRRIHVAARGVPRRINLLCDRALLGGYATGARVVTAQIVDKAAREVFFQPTGRTPAAPRPAAVPAAAPAAGAPAAPPAPAAARSALAGPAVVAAVVLLCVGIAGGWYLARRTPVAGAVAGAGTAVVPGAGAAVAATGTVAQGGATSGAKAGPGTPASAVPASPLSAATGVAATASAPSAADTGTAGNGSTAATSAAAADGAPFDLRAALPGLPRDEDAALRALAAGWGVPADGLAAGAACPALAREGLPCFRSSRTGLNLVRQIDRPGLLTLVGDDGRTAVVPLAGLDAQHATLVVDGAPRRVPLAELARWWRGDFTTLWRIPPGATPAQAETATGPAGTWLDAQLAALQPGGAAANADAPAAERRARIYRFQLAQGLKPDGVAGPLTFMLLNRAAGVAEPRLTSGT